MKRYWPLVLAVALLGATNVAWAYVVLNNAVTATYQQDEAERVRVSRDQLLVLSNALLKDISLQQLRESARERLDSGAFIQEEDHRLFIDCSCARRFQYGSWLACSAAHDRVFVCGASGHHVVAASPFISSIPCSTYGKGSVQYLRSA
jgi:hypothetical protein